MKKIFLLFGAVSLLSLATGCQPAPTANDAQRDQQSRITSEGAAEVGMPNIHHFREMRIVKQIYEARDQDDLSTWTYVFNMYTGKFVFICASIGYPIPYATQYSAPESMQTYNVHSSGSGNVYGVERLPQAEPNGLNMPTSADASWVMCIAPDKKPHPQYEEDKLDAFTYQLPDSMLQK